MTRLTPGTKLVVASHNPGKVWEIRELIAPYGFDAISAGDLGLSEPEETEPSFEGNARLKAFAAAQGSGLPALADDFGARSEGSRRSTWDLFGALGRSDEGLRPRHAARA